MTVYQWLCLFSVPALILMIVKYMLNQIKQNQEGHGSGEIGPSGPSQKPNDFRL